MTTHHVAVDLVGDDRQLVALSQADDVDQVLPAVDAPARIRRVVDDDGHCVLVNEAFETLEIYLPIIVLLQEWKGN